MCGGLWCGLAEGAELVVDVPRVELPAHQLPGKGLEVGVEFGFFGCREEVEEGGAVDGAPFGLAC